ncbi:divalent-cation tolerance protein CutA [Candidatus Micrarchaeota archaeon]|nr:divalent-cation tolerance protein CutA [Candidatus Micrarchaeota archaeon]
MTEFCMVFTTAASEGEAWKIADSVLAKRLAAIASVHPRITSKYSVNGKVESATEAVLVFKTTVNRAKELAVEIKGMHKDETPEVLIVPVDGGLKDYLDWIEAETKSPAVAGK